MTLLCLQKWNERAKSRSSVAKKRDHDVTIDDDDVNENIPPAEDELSSQNETPAKKQKPAPDVDNDVINDDIIDATPAAVSNSKSKLSAFAYVTPE